MKWNKFIFNIMILRDNKEWCIR